MFKSIRYIKYIGYNETTKLYSCEYEITDSDFVATCVGTGDFARAARAVISEYSKRNLNVPSNLLKFFLFYEKLYGTSYNSIKQQMEFCQKYQPLFTEKLKKELEKYLVLV